jgi:glutathione S-transferase
MPEVILHHYQLSPFSEKIRRVLAFKGIPWRSVETPLLLPKAELTALTGAYRRAPVMQIGADVYCDTALIARRLEQLFPEPAILPSALAGAATIWEDWADHRLVHQVTPAVVVELLEAFPPGFFEDRAKMTPNWSREAFITAGPHGLEETRQSLDALAAHLGSSQFLLGDTFTLADAACFNPVGFLRMAPALLAEIESRPALAAWIKRIEDFGPGNFRAMSGADALGIARETELQDTDDIEDTTGDSVTGVTYQAGDIVSVIADDYGTETLTGKVERVRRNDMTILREDTELGTVAVHYPRAGYNITKQSD